MPITADHIVEKLSGYRSRLCGSEDEMLAREELMAILTGENGVDVFEEGFFAPRTHFWFLWVLFLGAALSVVIVNLSPFSSVLGLLLFGSSFILYTEGRKSPLLWFYTRAETANLIAEKTTGNDQSPLVIVMANMDSPPASFMHKPAMIRYFKSIILSCYGLFGLVFLLPLFAFAGIAIQSGIILFFILLLISIPLFQTLYYWLYGTGKANLSGVAVATEVACRLFRTMPENTEIRLLITSAGYTGRLGAQHYYSMHKEELKARPTYVLNFDSMDGSQITCLKEVGCVFPIPYSGSVIETAYGLSKTVEAYKGVHFTICDQGYFDSDWFMRTGIPCLTLTTESAGQIQAFVQDDNQPTEPENLLKSIDYAEDIIRALPLRG